MHQLREYLPKGYIEKFKDAAISQMPSFLQMELTEEVLDMWVEKLRAIRFKNGLSEIEKQQMIAWLRWLENSIRQQAEAHTEALEKTQEFINKPKQYSKDNYQKMLYDVGIENSGSHLKEDDLIRNLLEFLWDYNDSGNRMFKIEEQLTHELFNTEIKKVDESFLKLPFQCCAFYLPFNNKITAKNHLVRSVYISEYEEDEGRLIKMLIIREDDAVVHFNWILKSGDIFTQIKNQLTEKYETKKIYKDMEDILQFIVGCLLYICSTEVDKREIYPLPKSHLNRDKISNYPCCSLGKGLTINRDLHYNKLPNDEEQKTQEMLIIKWTVIGHFKGQWYGSGSLGKFKKTIWIRPYLKGRERSNEEISIKPNFHTV